MKTVESKRERTRIRLLWTILIIVCCIPVFLISMARADKVPPLVMMNTSGDIVFYEVKWLDHNLEKYKGRAITRFVGELRPHETKCVRTGALRLCYGKHIVSWNKRDVGIYKKYEFIVTKKMGPLIILSQDGLK